MATDARRLLLALAVLVPAAARAAGDTGAAAAQPQVWRVTPQVALTETYSDNVALSSATPRGGWITSLAPGVAIEARGQHVRGNLDLRFYELAYSGNLRPSSNQKALNTKLTLEPISHWLFVDLRGSISQQNRSAFSSVLNDPAGTSAATQTETRVFQLSPYIRGQFGDVAAYQLRLNETSGSSGDGTLAGSRMRQWYATLQNANAGARLGWSATADLTSADSSAVGRRSDNRVRLSINYELLPLLHLSASGAYENTDFLGGSRKSMTGGGVGLQWSPTPRTQAAYLREKRFFGSGHSLHLGHRTGWMALGYDDSKDVSLLPGAVAASGPGSISSLLSDLMAASIPDPMTRAGAVRERLESSGQPQFSTAGAGVLSSRVTLNHTREASLLLLGVKNTVSFKLTRRDQTALGTAPGATDSFSLSSSIGLTSANVNWTHKLTPMTSLSLSDARSRNDGSSGTGLSTRQSTQNLVLSTQLGPQTTSSLAYRHVRFEAAAGGYFENALLLSLTQRF